MSETTDSAALIAEAAEYDSDSAWCGNLIQDLAAALASAEREIAKAWDEGFRTAALGISSHYAAPNDAPDA